MVYRVRKYSRTTVNIYCCAVFYCRLVFFDAIPSPTYRKVAPEGKENKFAKNQRCEFFQRGQGWREVHFYVPQKKARKDIRIALQARKDANACDENPRAAKR